MDEQGSSEHKELCVKNEKALRESRRKILESADYIIPSHGKVFKIKK